MKEKILALLVAAFAGVRKDGLNQLARTLALQATTDEEAKTIVDKLTEAQVKEFVKDYRAEVDKEVSESSKTIESNLKKKFDFVEKNPNEPGDGGKGNKGGDPNDIAALVKAALAEELNPLKQELASYKAGDVAKARLQAVTEKLNGCKDETLKAKALKDFGRMSFDSDEAFNEYLGETETDIATANQNVANASLGGAGKPFFAQKEESGISKGVAEYVASQNPENNVLSGKEV